MNARALPLAFAVAIVSFSFAAIFFRLASPTHPLIVAGTRLAIASSILAVPTVRAFARARMSARIVRAGIVGGVLYGLHFGTWVTSLTMTGIASSVTLVTATPLLLAVLAFVTGRDRPARRHRISIALAMVGVTLIGWADLSLSHEALIGDALALGGAVTMALYLLLVRSLGPDLDVLAFAGIATAVGAISLFGAAVALGVPIRFASNESILWVALAALVPQLIGHNILMWALRHATPTAVGIATVGEPVGATLLGWLWLGEAPVIIVLIGCLVTLAAVVLSVRAPGKIDRAVGEIPD
jgi:drug/metabolite transporter (DMT)-like permease